MDHLSIVCHLFFLWQIIKDLDTSEVKNEKGHVIGSTNDVKKLVYGDIKRWLKAQDMVGNLPDPDELLYIRSKVLIMTRT